MLGATKDRPLLTTTTGGLPRPGWYTESLAERPFSTAMAGRSFREQYRDLVAALFADQNRAGIDILVDGDARFDGDVAGRQWIAYPEERLAGLGAPELRSYPIHQGKSPGSSCTRSWKRGCPGRLPDRSAPARWNTTASG